MPRLETSRGLTLWFSLPSRVWMVRPKVEKPARRHHWPEGVWKKRGWLKRAAFCSGQTVKPEMVTIGLGPWLEVTQLI